MSHAECREGHQRPAIVSAAAGCDMQSKSLESSAFCSLQRHHVGQEYGPQVESRPANNAYPAISSASPCSLGPNFEGQLCRIPVGRNDALETFPWQEEQGWMRRHRKDFQVPSHLAPDTEGATILVMSGFCGEPLGDGAYVYLVHMCCITSWSSRDTHAEFASVSEVCVL